MFLLPKSPFEREKMRLGDGFLEGENAPPPPRQSPYRPRLTPEERLAIGRTGRDDNAAEIAERYGVSVNWVYQLRYRYRHPERRKRGRGL